MFVYKCRIEVVKKKKKQIYLVETNLIDLLPLLSFQINWYEDEDKDGKRNEMVDNNILRFLCILSFGDLKFSL